MGSNGLGLRGCRKIRNYPWYPLLVPPKLTYSSNGTSGSRLVGLALLDDYNPERLLGTSIVVCLTTSSKGSSNKTETRNYSVFESPSALLNYISVFPESERSFYETILGEFPQKPHFDIDLNPDDLSFFGSSSGLEEGASRIVSETIGSILDELDSVGVKLDPSRDLLLFTSSDPGANKYSYHIIIDNYLHRTHREAAAFYQRVMMRLPSDWSLKGWVDPKVYSSKQNFRLIGSTKLGKTRYKTLMEQWFHPKTGEIISYRPDPNESNWALARFKSSLVSYTSESKLLPPFTTPERPERTRIRESSEEIEVTLEEAAMALEMISYSYNIPVESRLFPFKLMEIRGPILVLKRLRPSWCRVCNKTHDHENPFILIIGKERSVHFDCRRTNRSIWLGNLGESLAVLWARNVILPNGETAIPNPELEPTDMSAQSVLDDLKGLSSSPKPIIKEEKVIEVNPQSILEDLKGLASSPKPVIKGGKVIDSNPQTQIKYQRKAKRDLCRTTNVVIKWDL